MIFQNFPHAVFHFFYDFGLSDERGYYFLNHGVLKWMLKSCMDLLTFIQGHFFRNNLSGLEKRVKVLKVSPNCELLNNDVKRTIQKRVSQGTNQNPPQSSFHRFQNKIKSLLLLLLFFSLIYSRDLRFLILFPSHPFPSSIISFLFSCH